MHKQTIAIAFVIGLALGVLAALFSPRYLRPYLPGSLAGKETAVKGTVLAKQKQGNALLMTVNTSQGALLATFRKKADEVNLLVGEKDEIEFIMEKYSPFIDEPKITRVMKEQQALSPAPAKAAAAPAKAAGKGAQEVKPQNQENVAPVPADKKTGK